MKKVTIKDIEQLTSLCPESREQVKNLLNKLDLIEEEKTKEAWKPEKGERYFYVTETGDSDWSIPNEVLDIKTESHNCFKNESDAYMAGLFVQWNQFLVHENVRLYDKFWQPGKNQKGYYIFTDSTKCVEKKPVIGVTPTWNIQRYKVCFKTCEDACEVVNRIPSSLRVWLTN